MNRTPATAQHAAKLAANLAKALAKAVDLTPCARARRLSAEATATAKAAKIAADYAEIIGLSGYPTAAPIADAFALARKVSALGEQAEREAREAGAL